MQTHAYLVNVTTSPSTRHVRIRGLSRGRILQLPNLPVRLMPARPQLVPIDWLAKNTATILQLQREGRLQVRSQNNVLWVIPEDGTLIPPVEPADLRTPRRTEGELPPELRGEMFFTNTKELGEHMPPGAWVKQHPLDSQQIKPITPDIRKTPDELFPKPLLSEMPEPSQEAVEAPPWPKPTPTLEALDEMLEDFATKAPSYVQDLPADLLSPGSEDTDEGDPLYTEPGAAHAPAPAIPPPTPQNPRRQGKSGRRR